MLLLALALACTSDLDTEDTGLEALDLDPDRIYEDVALFASDTLGGRLPATQGNEVALRYLEWELDRWGLEPAGTQGWRQPFSILQWVLHDTPSLSLGHVELEPGADFELIGGSGSAEVEDSPVVFAGYGLTVPPFDAGAHPGCPLPDTGYDDYQDIDVTDKVVLLLRHGPADDEDIYERCPVNEAGGGKTGQAWLFAYKARNAKIHGARAVLLVNDYRHGPEVPTGEMGEGVGLPLFGVQRWRLEEELSWLAAAAGVIDSDYAPASRDTTLTASLQVEADMEERTTHNLHAVVPGNELADEVVILGAHMDHLGTDPTTGDIYNGADDNASGSAVVLELARLAARTQPERTLLFSWYNAEEIGLLGSCYYVEEEPLYPVDHTALMVSVDMVGAGVGEGLMLFGAEEGQAWVGDLFDAASEAGDLDAAVATSGPLMASDHACFAMKGAPAVLASTLGVHPTYHTPEDTIEGIDPDDLQVAAELMWAALEPMAMGTEDQLTGRRSRQESLPASPLDRRYRDR